MRFATIRFILWLIVMALPFVAYSIASVSYPKEISTLVYALAIAGIFAGTIARIPLRAGNDPTHFPVRAAEGCSAIFAPTLAVLVLWVMPFLPPTASKLIVLGVVVLVTLSALSFLTIRKLVSGTPRP